MNSELRYKLENVFEWIDYWFVFVYKVIVKTFWSVIFEILLKDNIYYFNKNDYNFCINFNYQLRYLRVKRPRVETSGGRCSHRIIGKLHRMRLKDWTIKLLKFNIGHFLLVKLIIFYELILIIVYLFVNYWVIYRTFCYSFVIRNLSIFWNQSNCHCYCAD